MVYLNHPALGQIFSGDASKNFPGRMGEWLLFAAVGGHFCSACQFAAVMAKQRNNG